MFYHAQTFQQLGSVAVHDINYDSLHVRRDVGDADDELPARRIVSPGKNGTPLTLPEARADFPLVRAYKYGLYSKH
ncbi:hypothetical protein DPMN_042013 [Dreissena polymorpha]|uniref:Uncharacterized protein n=1 Tax=Dreissena polymorpha TaxID=45954 RepID=A0A9D4CXT2_DREPO|nr:hypothetical protein DPMN_042013 [Dreissena polymorpha]